MIDIQITNYYDLFYLLVVFVGAYAFGVFCYGLLEGYLTYLLVKKGWMKKGE